MKTYLLQIQTSDLGLQLLTEVSAATVEQLRLLAARMVKSYPSVKGMAYRIFETTGMVKTGDFDSELVKEGVVSK